MKKRKVQWCAALLMVMAGLWLFATTSEAAGAVKKGGTLTVSEGKTVKVNYTLTVDGKVIESSNKSQPIQFTPGSRQMIPGFEKAVMGMKVGEKKSFKVKPEEGYGKEDPRAIQNVAINKLPAGITPKAGMSLQARDKNGQTRIVKIMEVRKDVVVMNFNHPLAGKTLNFDVQIVEIK